MSSYKSTEGSVVVYLQPFIATKLLTQRGKNPESLIETNYGIPGQASWKSSYGRWYIKVVWSPEQKILPASFMELKIRDWLNIRKHMKRRPNIFIMVWVCLFI